MSLKSNLLKWLQSASQRKHRASEAENQGSKEEAEEEAQESQPEKETISGPEKAEAHQERYEP